MAPLGATSCHKGHPSPEAKNYFNPIVGIILLYYYNNALSRQHLFTDDAVCQVVTSFV